MAPSNIEGDEVPTELERLQSAYQDGAKYFLLDSMIFDLIADVDVSRVLFVAPTSVSMNPGTRCKAEGVR